MCETRFKEQVASLQRLDHGEIGTSGESTSGEFSTSGRFLQRMQPK